MSVHGDGDPERFPGNSLHHRAPVIIKKRQWVCPRVHGDGEGKRCLEGAEEEEEEEEEDEALFVLLKCVCVCVCVCVCIAGKRGGGGGTVL
jgi:hypothetical protein